MQQKQLKSATKMPDVLGAVFEHLSVKRVKMNEIFVAQQLQCLEKENATSQYSSLIITCDDRNQNTPCPIRG